MIVIPVQPLPSQTLQVQLDQQACTLNIYQNTYGLFVDVFSDNILIAGGVVALNLVRMLRDIATGFRGDLAFYDTQGNSDPIYTGLGNRFVLVYLDADEIVT